MMILFLEDKFMMQKEKQGIYDQIEEVHKAAKEGGHKAEAAVLAALLACMGVGDRFVIRLAFYILPVMKEVKNEVARLQGMFN
jgi:hypothetical protein